MQKQPIIATSVYEAEMISAQAAVKETILMRNLLAEMEIKLKSTPMLKMDNQAGLESLSQPCFRKNSRHMAIKWYFVKEAVTNKEIKTQCQNTPIQEEICYAGQYMGITWPRQDLVGYDFARYDKHHVVQDITLHNIPI